MLPAAITQERSEVLAQKIIDKTLNSLEREELICGYMRFAYAITSSFTIYSTAKFEDVLTEAFYGLIKGVDKANDALVDTNIKSYLATWIRKYILKCLHERAGIEIQIDTLLRMKKQNKVILKASSDTSLLATEQFDSLAFFELIGKCVKTELDKEIVLLRVQNHTDTEIGEKLGKTQSWIQRCRDEMYERYIKLTKDSK